MPPRRPTYRRMLSGALRESACATAIAGNKCPPVPPPEINTRMSNPSHLLALRRDVQQYADGAQRDGQRRATITYEGQGNAGRGQRHRDSRDVDQRLDRDPGGDAAGEERAERIRGLERDPVTAIGKKAEEGEHRGGADQPGLLADDREDEIGVGKGQPLIFLNTLAQSDAHDASRSERDHRLDCLEAGVERVGPWVEEG